MNPSPNARGKQKLAREVAEVKKDLRNSERREKRTREKFEAMKVEVEGTEMAIQITSDENDLLRSVSGKIKGMCAVRLD